MKHINTVVGIFLTLVLGISVAGGVLLLSPPTTIFADRVDELKEEIEERSERIREIENDIEQYEHDLSVVREKQNTLQARIQELRSSENKIASNIELVRQQISSIELEIEQINLNLQKQQTLIEKNQLALRSAVQTINELDESTLVEKMLAYDSLTEVWEAMDTLRAFQQSLDKDLREIRDLRNQINEDKSKELSKKQELERLRATYNDEHQIIAQNRSEQDALLTRTKSEEAEYQAMLEEKRQQKERFLSQLHDLESQLETAVNPATIPQTGKGTFVWPVDEVVITQQFGGTAFAKNNADVYGRPYHNGTDFGVREGSPIYAVRSGVVVGTGNTDAFPGCYSYGKWILLEHNNGLSTLYGHLSSHKVSAGQQVQRGQVIGYSGNTGYSTGPHLHLTTYLSDSVEIVRFGDYKDITSCGDAHIPVAPLEAYLDPMPYMP